MEQPHIFVSRRVPESVHRLLDTTFALDYHDSPHPLSRGDLLERVSAADGLVTTLTERVDEELLDAAGSGLAVVANYAVGFDNIDLDAASARRVLVANTPDVLSQATAEFAVALMMSLLRRVSEGDRFLRGGADWIWAPTFMLGTGMHGRTLGIVGFGRIGKEVARLATGLGMHVVYANPAAVPSADYQQIPLAQLLERSDVVSVHCPLTPQTRHLIAAEELAAMRSDAFLVNTSRGPVVDEAALVTALRRGDIAGAALDVFEYEPHVCEGLLELDNVVLAPHLASATHEVRDAMGMLCVEALKAVLLEHRAPKNAVNAAAIGLPS